MTTDEQMAVTQKEKALILFIRELGFGDFKVEVRQGQPQYAKEALKTVQL